MRSMRDDQTSIKPPSSFDRPGDAWSEFDGTRQRNWSSVRRRLTFLALAIATLVTGVGFFVTPSSRIFKPGPLSKPHAQILAGTLTKERCGSCHSGGMQSPLKWLVPSPNHEHSMTQTDLCLDCHKRTIPMENARRAHNLSRSARKQLTAALKAASANRVSLVSIPKTRLDFDNVACAVCHREHHGSDASLIDLSNSQCQTCHSQVYGDFANSHPEWGNWPYDQTSEIRFDHSTHAGKHFPGWKGGQSFDCQSCHPMPNQVGTRASSVEDAMVRVAPFETACAGCHDESLRAQLNEGISLISLPTLPSEATTALRDWPESATGFADGRVTPIMHLLLRSDSRLASLLRKIRDDDLGNLVIKDQISNQELQALAKGISDLCSEIVNDGHAAILNRMSQSGIQDKALHPALVPLPTQLLETIKSRWMRDHSDPPAQRSASVDSQDLSMPGDSLLSDDLLAPTGDDLLLPTDESDDVLLLPDDSGDLIQLESNESQSNDLSRDASNATASRDAEKQQLLLDGWRRDDGRLTISYRGTQHADPVITAFIEGFSALPDTDPAKRDFSEMPLIKNCLSCHPGASHSPSRWAEPTVQSASIDSNKFHHRPHLNVSKLGDCNHCHQVTTLNDLDGEIDFAMNSHPDFQPLTKSACAACHSKEGAGENCTQCHRYHMTRP